MTSLSKKHIDASAIRYMGDNIRQGATALFYWNDGLFSWNCARHIIDGDPNPSHDHHVQVTHHQGGYLMFNPAQNTSSFHRTVRQALDAWYEYNLENPGEPRETWKGVTFTLSQARGWMATDEKSTYLADELDLSMPELDRFIAPGLTMISYLEYRMELMIEKYGV